uniref:Uncharacterized protein n=1 Tax=Siphoviridae sp. ctREU2 TaxID=2826333 RepID=A0A8S5NIU8_9CAUD|nr:MAG TPA: hypothetical protein [Siphoviridae sp. ctREU2]
MPRCRFFTDKVYYFTYKRTLFLLRIVFLHYNEKVCILNTFIVYLHTNK